MLRRVINSCGSTGGCNVSSQAKPAPWALQPTKTREPVSRERRGRQGRGGRQGRAGQGGREGPAAREGTGDSLRSHFARREGRASPSRPGPPVPAWLAGPAVPFLVGPGPAAEGPCGCGAGLGAGVGLSAHGEGAGGEGQREKNPARAPARTRAKAAPSQSPPAARRPGGEVPAGGGCAPRVRAGAVRAGQEQSAARGGGRDPAGPGPARRLRARLPGEDLTPSPREGSHRGGDTWDTTSVDPDPGTGRGAGTPWRHAGGGGRRPTAARHAGVWEMGRRKAPLPPFKPRGGGMGKQRGRRVPKMTARA